MLTRRREDLAEREDNSPIHEEDFIFIPKDVMTRK